MFRRSHLPAVLTLALSLAAAGCADTPTAQREAADPEVAALSQRLGSDVKVTSVRSGTRVIPGVPDRTGGPQGGCGKGEPCFLVSGNGWSVDANIAASFVPAGKQVILAGSASAWFQVQSVDLVTSFRTLGGCQPASSLGYNQQYKVKYIPYTSAPTTITAADTVIYSGGTVTWQVYADAIAQVDPANTGPRMLNDTRTVCF